MISSRAERCHGRPLSAGALALLAAFSITAPAVNAAEFYDGKTVAIMVGLAPGGTVDTMARQFADVWQKYTPGHPNMLVKNMTGGGGMKATNYVYEAAAKDGMTILFGPWIPIAQALHYQGFRARYENFAYLGGVADTRVSYCRTDVIPGGLKKPADIMKVKSLWIGGNSATGAAHLAARIPLDVLGIKYKQIVGYRGGSDVFLALVRGEIQYTGTSIGTFRTRSKDFIASGKGMGLFYLVPVEPDGTYERSKYITEMPAFPDLYKQIYGKMPSGPTWNALNWFVTLIGTMNYVGLAPPGTPAEAVAALRKGFDGLSKDAALNAAGEKRNGIPYKFVGVKKGEQVIAALRDTDPKVLATFKELVESGSKSAERVKGGGRKGRR